MSADQELQTLVFESRPRPDLTDQRLAQHPRGVVAVLTREVGTYRDFIFSYRRLCVPRGSGEASLAGAEKVDARNTAVDALLANAGCDWLYQLDDDHKFPPTVLLDQLDVLYAEDFDVLGILYLARVAPPSYPVGGIFTRDAKRDLQIRKLAWADLPAFGNVLERRDLCLGTAGLLTRRRVFDKLSRPFFQVGQVEPGREWEDLYFSIRCQEAGLKVGLWLGPAAGYVGLGHTGRCTLWASRDGKGGWGVGVDMDVALDAAALPAPPHANGLSRIVTLSGRRR